MVEERAFKTLHHRTSLVVQWLGICLALQGMEVQSPVGELSSYVP